MRKLEVLKNDLLDNKVERFYVFFGNDIGIRKHYIDKINTYFPHKFVVDDYSQISVAATSNSLFIIKQLFVIYDDMTFANLKADEISRFISRLNENYTCIFVYNDIGFEKSILFKEFEDYCTEFQPVQPNIAKEFVEIELDGLSESSEKELVFNCGNLYSNILLETDKVKQYSDYVNSSQQVAYDSLKVKNQLLHTDIEFSSSEFMNCVLQFNYTGMSDWCDTIKTESNQDLFYKCIPFMFNDFLIAGMIKQFGEYEGGQLAYSYGLPWGRIKEIKTLVLPDKVTSDYYFECAFMLSKIDIMVKKGLLEKSKLVDYFLIRVI